MFLDRVFRLGERIVEILNRLEAKVMHMSAQLDKLTSDVTALQTAVTGLVTLNDTTQQQLATLIAQGSATPDDLTAVTASIEAATKQITDDLAKTTAPSVPPAT